ncbi:MAG TPA: hypothetical protein VIX90_16955 [Edaphobacter sp.]
MSETKRYQCRHIFTEGRRCGSPSLRHEDFCYYHHTARRPAPDPRLRQNSDDRYAFDLPLPEDRAAIQLAIGHILLRIAHNQIDSKRAGLLLYGLQIASSNLPRQNPKQTQPPQVEEITTHPDLGLLAPPAEYDEDTASGRPRSIMRQLLDQFALDNAKGEPGCPILSAPDRAKVGQSPNPGTDAGTNPGAPHLDSEMWVSSQAPQQPETNTPTDQILPTLQATVETAPLLSNNWTRTKKQQTRPDFLSNYKQKTYKSISPGERGIVDPQGRKRYTH